MMMRAARTKKFCDVKAAMAMSSAQMILAMGFMVCRKLFPSTYSRKPFIVPHPLSRHRP